MAISKRLMTVAKYIHGYDTLADIACDHGYLGIYAAQNFNIKEVLLTDINEKGEASEYYAYFNITILDSIKTRIEKRYNKQLIAFVILIFIYLPLSLRFSFRF